MSRAVLTGGHLYYEELACHDAAMTTYPLDLRETVLVPILAPEFEVVRAAIHETCGRELPIHVLSAFRTPTYNRRGGGSSGSYHVKGMAIDAIVRELTVLEFALLVVRIAHERKVIRGVGFYPHRGFVHFDVRPTKKLALWREDERRKIVAWSGAG